MHGKSTQNKISMQNLLKLISPKEKSTAMRQMRRRAYTLQSLSRCPKIDKPAASKAQDAKYTVIFPVVDGSATGAGRTFEQIGPFRETRQFDKLGFFHDVSEPVSEGLPCQSLRQSFHIYVVRLAYPFYRKASVFNPGMDSSPGGG